MKQEHQPNIQAEDTIAGGATMYPVFCIASIPLNVRVSVIPSYAYSFYMLV
jgi:hypothetical protein